MATGERVAVLAALLDASGSVSELLSRLSEFPWDSEEELVQLELSHVRGVLNRYLGGALTSDEVETWAEALESRDDVGVDEGAEGVLRDVIWTLANPELAEPLSPDVARGLLSRLNARSGAGVAPRE